MSRSTSRKTVLAFLLAFTLLLSSYTVGTSAYADVPTVPTAVFYGYVIPEVGSVLPKRVRAVSDRGVVCGSANVEPMAYFAAGFYALPVVSAAVKDGCPLASEMIRFVLIYDLIDEDNPVGEPTRFEPGAVTQRHFAQFARVPVAQP